ncbi:hypothetical protein CEXT_418721 [Caerostris extrusa]|uniref:Uncharacterized protein n=1 Tax=Caerostris extrusa TaxID=172846 RepID=A0AAV4TAQ1_CAEEX|nr:hypothetical protein CEXT_418721 [Caerostris extrusa]
MVQKHPFLAMMRLPLINGLFSFLSSLSSGLLQPDFFFSFFFSPGWVLGVEISGVVREVSGGISSRRQDFPQKKYGSVRADGTNIPSL